ncbi:MAG: TonB-dependent receptor [Janthinobacterium lividum]
MSIVVLAVASPLAHAAADYPSTDVGAPVGAESSSTAVVEPTQTSTKQAPTFETNRLPTVEVSGTRSVADKKQLPQTTESVTARQLADTVNATDVEDAIKYLPDMLVRKRFIGDTQAPMATRTTGINASARSLIYVDGILLSTLINNNNGNGSPQWFMVAPQQVERIDVLYGPFAAAYPGNSYGAVTEITTRMPKQFEASADITTAWQNFDLYGTQQTFPSQQYSATLGNKADKLSWFFSANHLDSFSQPITFGTLTQSITRAGASLPVIGGAIAGVTRTGAAEQIIAGSNFTHTLQDDVTLKLAYDFTPTLSASYTVGYWQNRSKATSESYLSSANGDAYYGATSGNVNIGGYQYSASSIASQFSSSYVEQEHLMQGLQLGTHTGGVFDWSAVVSHFQYLQDLTRLSTGLYPAALTSGPGRVTDMSGTGWTTLDLNGVLRPTGVWAANALSFGVHFDQFKLVSPTFKTADFVSADGGSLYSNSLGSTHTTALWLQDVWKLSPSLRATLGARYEMWRAYDGFNFSTESNGLGVAVNQPGLSRSGLSPKASLTWDATDLWSITGSFGKALRFPTVGELYQTVQTGSTYLQANPFLKPESVLSGELALERNAEDSKLRLSVFDEYVSNALISQTSIIAGFATPVSLTQNVDKTRETGIELVLQHDNVLIKGLELAGSVTYVDAHILADSAYVPTIAGASAVGSRTPYVPTWRATVAATYRPNYQWAFTVAGRYSTRMFGTVDNTDINSNTYMGFQGYLVADVRANYQHDRHWSVAAGIDNLNNQKYFLYHPFPQRTFFAELKYAL